MSADMSSTAKVRAALQRSEMGLQSEEEPVAPMQRFAWGALTFLWCRFTALDLLRRELLLPPELALAAPPPFCTMPPPLPPKAAGVEVAVETGDEPVTSVGSSAGGAVSSATTSRGEVEVAYGCANGRRSGVPAASPEKVMQVGLL